MRERHQPALVINAAACMAVDRSESEGEAMDGNGNSLGAMALG